MANQFENIINAVKMTGITSADGGVTVYRSTLVPATERDFSRVAMVKGSDGSDRLYIESYSAGDMVNRREVSPSDVLLLDYIADRMKHMYVDRVLLIEALKAKGLSEDAGAVRFEAGGVTFSATLDRSASGTVRYTGFRVHDPSQAGQANGLSPYGPLLSEEAANALLSLLPKERQETLSKTFHVLTDLLEHELHVSRKLPDFGLLAGSDNSYSSLVKFLNAFADYNGGETACIFEADDTKARAVSTLNTANTFRLFLLEKESDFKETPDKVNFLEGVKVRMQTDHFFRDGHFTSVEKVIDGESTPAEVAHFRNTVLMDCHDTGIITKAELDSLMNAKREEVKEEKPSVPEDFRRNTTAGRANLTDRRLMKATLAALLNIAEGRGKHLLDHNITIQSFKTPYVGQAAAVLALDAKLRGYDTGVYLTKWECGQNGIRINKEAVPTDIRYDKPQVYVRRPHKKADISVAEYLRLPKEMKDKFELDTVTIYKSVYNLAQTDFPAKNPELYKSFIEAGKIKYDENMGNPVELAPVFDSMYKEKDLSYHLADAFIGRSFGAGATVSQEKAGQMLDHLKSLPYKDAVKYVSDAVKKAQEVSGTVCRDFGLKPYKAADLKTLLDNDKSLTPKI